MADSPKLTVLLADEDSLRRDGLALVLRENQQIEILAGLSDGPTAFEKIRELCPDVAVVDLNLPGLHGIELTRRVQARV
jgi:two-component system response regulator DesR